MSKKHIHVSLRITLLENKGIKNVTSKNEKENNKKKWWRIVLYSITYTHHFFQLLCCPYHCIQLRYVPYKNIPGWSLQNADDMFFMRFFHSFKKKNVSTVNMSRLSTIQYNPPECQYVFFSWNIFFYMSTFCIKN